MSNVHQFVVAAVHSVFKAYGLMPRYGQCSPWVFMDLMADPHLIPKTSSYHPSFTFILVAGVPIYPCIRISQNNLSLLFYTELPK